MGLIADRMYFVVKAFMGFLEAEVKWARRNFLLDHFVLAFSARVWFHKIGIIWYINMKSFEACYRSSQRRLIFMISGRPAMIIDPTHMEYTCSANCLRSKWRSIVDEWVYTQTKKHFLITIKGNRSALKKRGHQFQGLPSWRRAIIIDGYVKKQKRRKILTTVEVGYYGTFLYIMCFLNTTTINFIDAINFIGAFQIYILEFNQSYLKRTDPFLISIQIELRPRAG